MTVKFQVIALSSRDPDGSNTEGEPCLDYAGALKTARELKSQGKAFHVIATGDQTDEQRRSFLDLGAVQ